MKNIKRILCLTLSAIMLCGMMVFNTGASFKDEAKIVNKEAAAITAGLGLFAGTTEGNFDPTGTVTRAQMAAVVTKMLYGSDFNADHFKGSGKFSDTATFEGGWAEGYINLCANIGVIAGYGDGTFKPGKAVTTAEAVTMIINALKVDAGEGTWPLTVMAKAEEMKLFKDVTVKPGTNEALIRDTLAAITLAGVQYSPAGNSGYRVEGIPFVITDLSTAILACDGNLDKLTEVVGEDSLANRVFKMTSATGFITNNQATGYDYTEIQYADNEKIDLNFETGLDMIGHYVTVYYAEEYTNNDPGVAYAIVDKAQYITVANDTIVKTRKEYQALFGSKKLATADTINTVDGVYTTTSETTIPDYDADQWTAPNGTYVVFENKIIGFIQSATKTLDKVSYVSNIAGKEYIKVGTTRMENHVDEDVVREYDGIAKDDYVIVVKSANNTYTLTKVEKIEGKITRLATVDGIDTITVNGTEYKKFEITNNTDLINDFTADDGSSNINFEATYAVYVIDGKYLGWSGVSAAANISDVIYIVGNYDLESTADTYGNKTNNYYAQGINMSGEEVSMLIGVEKLNTDGTVSEILGEKTLKDGFYTFNLSTDRDEKKVNIMSADPLNEDSENSIYTQKLPTQDALTSDSAFVEVSGDIAFLTNATKFIIVDGSTAGGKLDVAMITGLYKTNVSDLPAILSQDSTRNINLEVVIIDGTVSIVSDDYIYMSEDQAAISSTTAHGIEYNVYFTGINENKNIIVDTNYDTGFYTYEITKDNNGIDIYTLKSATSPECAANIKVDETFVRVNGTKLISENIKALNAATAKIIDVRSADDIKNSDVSEITMLEDLTAAKNADFTVEFTAILDEDLKIVTHIFITDVQ